MKGNDQEFHNCPMCFVYYSAPNALFEARRADGKNFYCPNGHILSYKDNEQDRIRQERDRLKQESARLEEARLLAIRQRDSARDKTHQTERRLAAQRGVTTRLKNRVANGVCPCCNRTFVDLARHMSTKHKGFVAEDVQAEVGVTVQ